MPAKRTNQKPFISVTSYKWHYPWWKVCQSNMCLTIFQIKKLLDFYLKEYCPHLWLILVTATWFFFLLPISKPVQSTNKIFNYCISTLSQVQSWGFYCLSNSNHVLWITCVYSLWPTSFPNLPLPPFYHLPFFSTLILKGKLSYIIMSFIINFPDCKIFEITGQTRKYGQSKLFGDWAKEEVSAINNLKSSKKIILR